MKIHKFIRTSACPPLRRSFIRYINAKTEQGGIAMKKTSKLRNLINSQQLEFLMEAHNGLSARIVEETGFKGIWGSGLSISASMGVRDYNEASWTQVLDILEFMSDA